MVAWADSVSSAELRLSVITALELDIGVQRKALVHRLTVVPPNLRDVDATGVSTINPWAFRAG